MAKTPKPGQKAKTHYVSKGLYPTVTHTMKKVLRRDYMATSERFSNQLRAWRAGKRVMLTVPNPNDKETNQRFIKIEARKLWGSPYNKRKKNEKGDSAG